jgi:hypothetical protein
LPFMGKTTTSEAFKGGPVEPRKPYQAPARAKVADVPFEAKTEAQSSFTGSRGERPKAVGKEDGPLSPQKFVGVSEFQKAYPKHAVRAVFEWR